MRQIKKSAFTLVEILVVVVLLGILAAIVIPQFTNASDDTTQAANDTSVHSLQALVELYRVENGAYPADIDDLETAGYIRAGSTAGFSVDAAGVVTAD